MFEIFKEIIEKNSTQEEMDVAMSNLELKDEHINELIEKIFDNQNSFNNDHLPFAIESLYKSNDKGKFMLSCVLLEATLEYLPYITRLENVPIFKAKLEFFYPTINAVFARTFNGIADCLAEIILNNDPSLSLASDEDRAGILKSLNNKLELLYNYFNENEHVDDAIYFSLEILLDLATYLNDVDTLNWLDKLSVSRINVSSKIFLTKALLVNNMVVSDQLIDELVKEEAYRFASVLSRINRLDVIENKDIVQEDIARSKMINWLMYPTELGDTLKDIVFVDKFEMDDMDYFIYKFTSTNDYFADKGYMLGVTGGYEKGKLSVDDCGHTFSKFEPIQDDYVEQAKEIVLMIIKMYQEQVSKMK